jgi:hypothetical protein
MSLCPVRVSSELGLRELKVYDRSDELLLRTVV